MRKSLCCAAALLSLAASPVPDIVPPNSKGVAVTSTLDLGPLADKVCLQYVVTAGDTFSGIAQRHLGSATRFREIIALNPDVNPRVLRVGARLWLPPRDDSVKQRRYLFLEVPFDSSLVPLTQDRELPFARMGHYILYVVPEAQLNIIEAKQKEQRPKGPVYRKPKGVELPKSITQLTGTSAGRYVKRDSPIAKIHCALKVEADLKGKLSIQTTTSYLDKNDKVLTAEDFAGEKGAGKKGDGKTPDEQLLLLLFAVGGGAWLLLRSRAPRVAPAAA